MKDSISKANNQHRKYVFLSIIGSLVFWQVVATWLNKPIILPSPLETLEAFVVIVGKPTFSVSVYHTLRRVVMGFSITTILALVLGVLSGLKPSIRYALKPIVTLFKAVPTMAVILLALIWLKSERAPTLVAFLVTFPILYQNVVEGLLQMDVRLIEMAQIYNIGQLKMIKDIYLPSLKNYLLAGISSALGLTVKIVIAAEVLSQPYMSIGTNFQMEKVNLNTAGVFAWSLFCVLLVAILDFGVKKILGGHKSSL